MSRIVLIHGFATNIGYSVFRPAYGADAGFAVFAQDVTRGEAKAFEWGVRDSASFFQSLNPFYTWNIYRREKRMASDKETYQRLRDFLMREQPEVVICHSMGCFLFLEYLKHQQLPTSVRRVLFNQADIPSTPTIPPTVEERIRSSSLSLANTYCPWDPTLWLSSIVSVSVKAGLVGVRHSFVQNRLFPLYRPWNLHMSALRDPGFRDLAYSNL